MVAFTLTVADPGALRTLFDKQLALGRAFVPDAGGVAALTACELVIEHGGRTHRLVAEVVFVKEEGPGRGVGLQLAPLDEGAKAALQRFVDGAPTQPSPLGTLGTGEGSDGDEGEPGALNLQERMRQLSTMEQQKIASGGTLTERIALERMYGPTVWETLLRNPRVTVPEVARIGRKGTLPKPLVEAIAANASWLAAGDIQRALLSNPRSSPAVITRVLQMLPRSDLQLVPQQTAYPAGVRQAARKMLTRT